MSRNGLSINPPKPRLVLRVGVTGKRAIDKTVEGRIRTDLEAIFTALADFLVACRLRHHLVFSDETPLLRIITGMAEGVDQIAADIAARRHDSETKKAPEGIETRLAAILPFRRAEYEKDFEYDPNRPAGQRKRTAAEWEDANKRFRNLLDHPCVDDVLEIDDEAVLDPEHPDYRNAAYAKLGAVLLEHTDVLIAVTDHVDGGAGGTVDVTRVAIKDDVPVIQLSTKKPEIFVLRAADPDAPDQTPVEGEKVESAAAAPDKRILPKDFAGVLGRMLEPPVSTSSSHGAGGHSAPSGRVRLERFFGEIFEPVWFDGVFKAFRNGMVAKVESKGSSTREFFRALRNKIKTPTKNFTDLWPAAKSDSLLAVDRRNAKFREILAARFAWADTLSIRYADATRSAYVLIGFLGAVAVLVGLSALLAPEEWAIYVKIAVLGLEGALLAYAGQFVFHPAHKERWHERMVEYRAVAELLRHQRFVYAFGGSDRIERTGDRSWREPNAWVGWYVRATLRELGFPTVVLSKPYRDATLAAFRRDELDEQQSYNTTLAKRFKTIDERLSRMTQLGWLFTVWAAFVGAALLIALYMIKTNHWCGYDFAVWFLEWLKPGLTVLMAFVPALIAAVHGIRFQMEFGNQADRSASTGRELAELDERLKTSLPAGASPGRLFSLAYVRSANETMSSDLAGWSNVYRGKSPEPP